MVFKVYAVRDEKASAYLPPVFLVNDGQAIRDFGDAVLNPKCGFSMHPEDYSFHCIGTYDNVSGKIVGHEPEFLTRAVDFVKVDKKEVVEA